MQKLSAVPALGAVFLTLTAVLFVQKPNLGLAPNQIQLASRTIADPGSSKLFSYQDQVEAKEPQKPRVASQTEVKKKEIFIDSINSTLPPVVEVKSAQVSQDVVGLIQKYAAEYGANADVMIAIARCESGFQANATSPSGAYKGIYQFVTSTWQSNRREMGLSDNPVLMYNLEEAIKTAAFKMGRDGYGAWPACHSYAIRQLSLAN